MNDLLTFVYHKLKSSTDSHVKTRLMYSTFNTVLPLPTRYRRKDQSISQIIPLLP